MALATGLQWPLTLYQGGLMGLQRPLLLQSVTAVTVTLRTAGAAVVLWTVSPTITAFFLWQAAATGVQTLATTLCLWHSMPPGRRWPRFDASLLRTRWRFAAGITATSAVTLMLTQLDKIVLSKLVSLELFAYYVLAATVADSLYKLVTPLYSSLFPQFSMLVALDDKPAMTALYHRSCQLLSVLVLPLALVIALFSVELIGLWTANSQAAQGAGPVVRVLILGTALNGLMSLPYAAQLAYGWVSLALVVNSIALIVLAPVLIVLVNRYGLLGAAGTWALLNLGYVLIEVPIMHRRILRGEWARWLFSDVAAPLVPAAAVVVLAHYIMPTGLSPLPQAMGIAAVAVIAMAGAALGAVEVRKRLVWLISRPVETV
jgi:O-antigen/teichoic acid export membrane protein